MFGGDSQGASGENNILGIEGSAMTPLTIFRG